MGLQGDHNDEEEVNYRIFACDIIENAGILLNLPQVALTTAQILLQRVYHASDYTFNKYYLDVTSMAALFLAAKIEEYPRKASEVIHAFSHVISAKLRRNIALSKSQHEKVREELITAERILLKTLGFNLLSSYPHMILVNYYLAMVRQLDREQNVWRELDNKRLLQLAWNYCNDSLRLDVFIRYSKEVVACACIQMASEDSQMVFPKSTDGRHWYGLFVNDEQEVRELIDIIRNLYGRKPVNPDSMTRLMYLTKFE